MNCCTYTEHDPLALRSPYSTKDGRCTHEAVEGQQYCLGHHPLITGILNVLNDAGVDPVVAFGGLQAATVSLLDEHFSEGTGERYMTAFTAFIEAELATNQRNRHRPPSRKTGR